MVPQMFCRPGMTSYRALFDVLGIPYLGNPPDVMAHRRRQGEGEGRSWPPPVWRCPTARCCDAVTGRTLGRRPSSNPSTRTTPSGVTLVRDRGRLRRRRLERAFAHCGRPGRDVRRTRPRGAVRHRRPRRRAGLPATGGVCGGPGLEADPGRTTTSSAAPGRRAPAGGQGRQYGHGSSTTDDPLTERVWEAARRCHVALGCRHYSLFDFRIDPAGQPWFLEAGLYCSFAPTSVIAVMAAAAGIDVADLFATALAELDLRGVPCASLL